MRSILLLILAVCVVGLAFGIYWVMLGSDEFTTVDVGSQSKVKPVATTLPTTSPTIIGPGDKPYYLRFDPKTGQLSSRLRAERYLPQQDGRWQVVKPEAEFFMDGGRVVRIVGETGVVTMENVAVKGDDALGGRVNQSPHSGSLYNVTLTLLPAIGQAPELTMTMHNASFNNETAQIYTEGYTENNRQVSGEMVPIKVRGEQYEFDGRGLRIRYNELDRRLEELRIMYGNRLLIRHPRMFMGGMSLPGQAPAAEKGAMLQGSPAGDWAWRATSPVEGVLLAAADSTGTEGARSGARGRRRQPPKTQPVSPASETSQEQPVYRATFQQDVEIYQGGRKIASARDMFVEYLTEAKGELSMIGPSTTRPSRPTARATSRPTTRASRSDRPRMPRTPASAEGGSKAANVDPMDEPLEIRWKGPLTIAPVQGDRPDRIAPGESIVKLIGSSNRPVEITQQMEQGTSRIRCAALTYWSIDSGVMLEEAPGIPVDLSDSRGTHITTRMLVFSERDGTALLTGKSHATLPLANDGGEPNQTPKTPADKADPKKDLMNVDWTDRCTLYLEGETLNDMVMNRIDLWGDVAVEHPQLKTHSETLQLRFAPQEDAGKAAQADKTAQSDNRSMPALQQVDASGNVRCEAIGAGGETDIRKINCDSLKLLTARTEQGRLYARNIIAMGHVYALDPEREMQAGYVHVTLGQPTTRPTTQPAVQPTTQVADKKRDVTPGELESLVAHDNVRVKTVDGKTAKANQLTIEVKEGVLTATLHGEPAEISDGKNTLSGSILSMAPERDRQA
ncbi:MAG TPA: hypothetical protein VHP11_02135 [Tepidisphaeraceae bacterium]|nr:hypothetical protein [Tepidisphaeraceae bacterium]